MKTAILSTKISGNGDDIWEKSDEGYFLFSEKTGSWSISAKVEWLERGGESVWAKIGLMIREKSQSANSKNLYFLLRAGYEQQPNKNLQTQWRSIDGNESYNSSLLTTPIITSQIEISQGIYLRLVRDARRHMFYSEWSHDGKNWQQHHSIQLEMNETVAYGIAITNHADNQLLARASVSEVFLEEAQPFFTRYLSSDRYTPNSRIDVLLYGLNPHQTDFDVTIQETIPSGWTVESIWYNGWLDNNVLNWNLSLPPGETSIQYTLLTPSVPAKKVNFSGSVNTQPIRGSEKAALSALTVNDFSQIEFYQTMFFTTVPLVMLILHLSLYLFNPKAKENLYFALMLGFLAGAEYCWNKKDFITNPNYLILLNLTFIGFVAGVFGCLENMFKYLIEQEKKESFDKKYTKRVLILFALISFILTFIYSGFPNLLELITVKSVVFILVSIGFIMWMRIFIITALIRRFEGIWIICIGTVILLSVVAWLVLSYFSIVPPPPDPKILDVAFLLFVITLSIYLAYKFAKSNIRLETLTVELENRVMQRTEELEAVNQDLHQANEELRELDKMKSQFVSQASHDLRTPLTAIKGSLDNLVIGIAGDLNEKQKRVMRRATKSVDRLSSLINDVLDLSRIESGRIVIEKSDIPFKTLVENIIQENLPAANQKKIQLISNLGDEITIQIDGGKIERAVGELISNAIKYTPEEGHVTISLCQNDDYSILSVQDSGIGMTPVECSKIWERFYRTSASKQFAKGSGLGLSIAKELVELHQGSLTVESEQGIGTTFKLQLPINERES
jgi:signal transduction histidine kinase